MIKFSRLVKSDVKNDLKYSAFDIIKHFSVGRLWLWISDKTFLFAFIEKLCDIRGSNVALENVITLSEAFFSMQIFAMRALHEMIF